VQRVFFYESKLCLRKFILLLFFSQCTPLQLSAYNGRLEVCRLLVESKADVAARSRCFSPPPSHHRSLTICLAAVTSLHSNTPSSTTNPTLLHTCAASARLNDALPRAAPPASCVRAHAKINIVLVRVAARRRMRCRHFTTRCITQANKNRRKCHTVFQFRV
jgi:hypothetical protein